MYNVATEVGRKWFVRECHDLCVVSALRETDEWVARNFIGETRTTVTQDAPLTVEEYQFTNCYWLLVVTLLFNETTFARTMTESLILQRALAALVTHWAVKRVISKKQFNHAFLCTLDLRCLCADNLSFGHWCHAANNHHWTAWSFNFNETLTAHTDRTHTWVVAETRNEFIGTVSCRNDEFTFLCFNSATVNRDADCVWILLRHLRRLGIRINSCHWATAVTGMRVRFVMRASNSSRNNVSAECTGTYADGPTKQIVFMRYGNGTAAMPSFSLEA